MTNKNKKPRKDRRLARHEAANNKRNQGAYQLQWELNAQLERNCV